MFYRQIIIIIILLMIIMIWYVIFNLIYDTIDITSPNIENFAVTNNFIKFTYADLNGKQLMTNSITVTPKDVDSTLKYYNYYSLFNKIDTADSFHFNVYSSFNISNNTQSSSDSSNYFSKIFTNKDLNNPYEFKYSSNIILLNKDIGNGQIAALKTYFVVDFINSDYNDTKFRIMSINIAVDNRTVPNYNNISFYYCSNTSDTVLPETSKLIKLNYIGAPTIETKAGNINIYRFAFATRDISPPSIDDITINFDTPNYQTVPVKIYYIQIYGLSENTYLRILRQLSNPQMFTDPTSNTVVMESGDVTTIDINLGDLDTDNNNIDNYGVANTQFNSTNLADVFRKIIRNNTPWGIYNGENIIYRSDINSVVLSDLLGRKCRDGIVNNVSKDDISKYIKYVDSSYNGLDINGNQVNITNKRIKQLMGEKDINIIFPLGSLPNKYTICTITRYTDNSAAGRIVTGKTCCSPVNFLLGHWGNYTNIMYNQGWYSAAPISGANTNWIVSCAKTTGNYNEKLNDGTYNTILFNGITSGRSNYIGLGIDSNNKDTDLVLTINGLRTETSKFGLTYVIIWDYILSDAELNLMSKNLINTVIDDSYQLPISDIVIKNAKDGLSIENVANNLQEIKQVTCSNTDGYYYININGIPQKVYCILNDNIGVFKGGWMLAMKGAKYSTTFMYNSPYWTTKNTLNKDTVINNLSDITTEIKTEVFNYYNFKEVLVIFNDPRFAAPYYKTSYYRLNNPNLIKTDKNGNETGVISLADFFANNYNDFYYANVNDKVILNNQNDIINYNQGSALGIRQINTNGDLNSFNIRYLANSSGFNYTNDIFSKQSIAMAFGLNLNFNSWAWNDKHKVRIGAVYNENNNENFTSIDVSNGVGLNAKRYNPGYAAGDLINCCQSSGGINDALPFLLFVR